MGNLTEPSPLPFGDDWSPAEPLPNRYTVRRDETPYLTCYETPNLKVRITRGESISSNAARRAPERTIFLDGAAQGEPFMEVKRHVYNLDHHEGCVRAFTLATCEQAMVLVLKGLDLGEGEWQIWGNEPDLDTVAAIWVLLNHQRLADPDDPSVRRRMMPLIRLEGVIDAHGYELRDMAALPQPLLSEVQDQIDGLRQHERELKRLKQWKSLDPLAYTASLLRAIDELAYSPHQLEEPHDIEELARIPLTNHRVGIVCRAGQGIYEVEQELRDALGERLGLIVLQQNPETYTIRQVDTFLPVGLDRVYGRLNQLDPRVTLTHRWGGSDQIGGSPRGVGTGLRARQIAEACRWVHAPPTAKRRLTLLLVQSLLATLILWASLVVGFTGQVAIPEPGVLRRADGPALLRVGLCMLAVAVTWLVLAARRRVPAQFGARRPAGLNWSVWLLPLLVAATAGGTFGAAAPDWGARAWAGVALMAVALEVLFRGALQGSLVSMFRVGYPGGPRRPSIPGLWSAALYAAAVTYLYFPAPGWTGNGWLIGAGLEVMLAALLAGVALAQARDWSGSLAAPIALHLVAVVFGLLLLQPLM